MRTPPRAADRSGRLIPIEGQAAPFLAAIVESSDDAILSKTLDGTITSWNKAAEKLYQYAAAEVIGKPITIIVPPEKRSELDHILDQIAKGKRIDHFETERIRKDGSRLTISLTVSPVHDVSGQIIGASAIARNVSAQRHFEVELRRREQQQATVARLGLLAFENPDVNSFLDQVVNEVAAMLDVEYCKVLELMPEGDKLLLKAGVGWNEGLVGQAYVGADMGSQAGYTLLCDEPVVVQDLTTEERFHGPPLLHDHGVISGISVIIPGNKGPLGVLGAHTRKRRTFTPDDANFIQAVANLIGNAVQRSQVEAELRTLNQTLENRVAQRTTALQLANAQLRKEIEDRERAEKEIERTNLILTHRNQELQEFAYVASHDLQEPLRKIRSFAELLNVDYGENVDEMGRFYLDRVQDAAARMSRLINDLLAFSRLVTQAQPFSPVDLNTIMEDVLSDLEVRIAEVNGTVEADSLPTIKGDPTQIRQVLQNLVGNALKFRRDDVSPLVRITSEKTTLDGKEAYRIDVEDNGIGFKQEDAEKIFSPFKRLHTRQQFPGTGMGLAIVRRIVERHGGVISATSTPDVGSTFSLILPVDHPDLQDVTP